MAKPSNSVHPNADAAIQRLTNLTFALLGSDRPREYEWVRSNVEGYENRTDVAFKRMITRDVVSLKRAGVPARAENGLVWVNKDAYELPPISFTDEEAFVLGLAGDLGTQGSLGAFARSGWTKIAAAGATRTFDEAPIAALDNDISRLDSDIVAAVTACVRAKTRMRFDYRPSPTADVQTRTMDPWGIVALNNRAYVVGFDVERQAPRSFRAVRVSNIRKVQVTDFTEADKPLQQVVEESLRGPVVDAVVTIEPGTCTELAAAGVTRADGALVFKGVERDWLVRTVASYAPHAVVDEPADVRDSVVALLRAAAQGGEEQ
ncbi:WYL domain-containing protein [Corynebacterium sp. MSK044]|uniref:helix-turn-helix transcriptional regulator n=1 Tax=Corynebacterium sp. MSK044 TaxID=3050195 RepID=UPI00254AAD8D|nr:WYL domain-containing protein [Corynebacterium sp. MSK044]MDK8796656.1 WYL domain-containing protein [Corynebacterium sp. MSK044]